MPATASPTGERITPIADANAEKGHACHDHRAAKCSNCQTNAANRNRSQADHPHELAVFLYKLFDKRDTAVDQTQHAGKVVKQFTADCSCYVNESSFQRFHLVCKTAARADCIALRAVVPRMMMLSLACNAFCASVAVFGSSCMLSSS